MSKFVEGDFTAYEFDDSEYSAATIFTELQKQHIKTELVTHLIQKNTLAADAYPDPITFVKMHEYYRGCIEALAALLRTSENSESDLLGNLQEETMLQRGASSEDRPIEHPSSIFKTETKET